MIGSVLGVLGLTRAEQELYEQLVGSSPMTLDAVGALADDAPAVLSRLHDLGLVTTAEGLWSAVPPDTALEVLVSDQGRALAQARRYVADLVDRFRHHDGDHAVPTLVEVVRGREEIVRRFFELQRGATREMRACDAPPYPANDATGVNTLAVEQLRAGLRFRILYDRIALDIPGRLAALEAGIAAGEEARVADIPLKMTLFDDTAAFLPVHQPPDVETRLIVRNPLLVEALSTLFEMYWDNGLPLQINKGRAEVADDRDGEPSDAERRLLVLLVAGLTDREIGVQLNVSERTVRSRVRSLMTRLDAGTRFQAGYQAVLRGWI
jgi:hypothetical protein